MALQHTAECWVREVCERCAGTGRLGQVRTYCDRCQSTWTAATLASHLDGHFGGWWGSRFKLLGDLLWQLFMRLPCGHKLKYLRYTDTTCPACHGEKYTYRWVTVREVRRDQGATQRPNAANATRPGGIRGSQGRFPGFPTTPPMRF